MKKHKILHISPDGVIYGTERHILSIVSNSDRNKFEHFVSVPREGSLTAALDEIGIKYFVGSRMPSKSNVVQGFWENGGFMKLFRTIKNNDFDIIHSHLVTYAGILAKFLGKKKLVHTRHGIFMTEEEISKISSIKKKFQKYKSDIFVKTIALSSIEKNVMVKTYNYDPKKIEIIYNGVTIENIKAKVNTSTDKKSLYGTNDFVVGGIGRFERQKGFHLFVAAASKVLKQVKNIKFVLIGNGSLRENILSQIKELGLEENFIILDYKSNVFDYLNNFDLMVSSSLWEGVPYAILEAMALGKPTIAISSNLSGVNEIIDDGADGFLIKDNYSDNLAEKILFLYNDKLKYVKFSSNCVDKIKSRFSEDAMIKKTEELYAGILNKEIS